MSCVNTITCRDCDSTTRRLATDPRQWWSSEETGSSKRMADRSAAVLSSAKKDAIERHRASPSLTTLATSIPGERLSCSLWYSAPRDPPASHHLNLNVMKPERLQLFRKAPG